MLYATYTDPVYGHDESGKPVLLVNRRSRINGESVVSVIVFEERPLAGPDIPHAVIVMDKQPPVSLVWKGENPFTEREEDLKRLTVRQSLYAHAVLKEKVRNWMNAVFFALLWTVTATLLVITVFHALRS